MTMQSKLGGDLESASVTRWRSLDAVELRFADGTKPLPLEPMLENVTRIDIAAITDPVLVVSVCGHVVALNVLAETLIGGHRSSLLGIPADRVLNVPTATGGVRDYASQLFVEHIAATGGARIEHVAGHQIPVDVLLCPDADGTTVVSCKLATPTLDRGAIRDEEVAAVGHDIKGPLSVISLELEALLEREDAAELAPPLRRIRKNLDLVDRLVNDLVDHASLDAVRFELHRQQIDLRTLLSDVVDRMHGTQRLQLAPLPAHPVLVLADALRIERVVGNLLHNALKYSAASSPVSLALVSAGEHAEVSVVDHGPGISHADAPTVFDKFRRAPSMLHHNGNGLGLFVSRKIVEAHGGTIGFDSTPGEGARFRFELPLASPC